jgi:hypothetical protein
MKIKLLLSLALVIIILAFPSCGQGDYPKDEGSKILQEMCQIDSEKLLKALNDTIIKDKNSEVIKDLKARKLYGESHKAQPGEDYVTSDEVYVPEKYRLTKDSDIIPGFIDGGGIKNLILDGTYHVDSDGTLVMGPGNWDLLCPNAETEGHNNR